MKATVDADIAARTEDIISSVLFNLGVNDIYNGLPAEAAWEANAGYILDAFHTKWPSIKVYMARPWLRGYDAGADTVAGWIANVVAARPGWAFAGPDERVWLKGGNNGATMTTDGVHYSAAGLAEVVSQWMTVLGY